jgi:class 3 adenylate cyclase
VRSLRCVGTLRQFLTDDKGTVAIIVFSGRESNTISACRCALKVKENFEDCGIASNIGISTGKVFFGPVGDERRCEMAWIGDSVNLSARLMGKAKDTIMVDKATCENASSEVAFEMFGMVELKGKGAVALYVPPRPACERAK